MVDFSFISNYNTLETALMKAQNSLNQSGTNQTKKATSKWMDVIESWSKEKESGAAEESAAAGEASTSTSRTNAAPAWTGTGDRYADYLDQLRQFAGNQSTSRVASSPWMEKVLNMPNTKTTAQMAKEEAAKTELTSQGAQTAARTSATPRTTEADRRQEQLDLIRQMSNLFGGSGSSWLW